jgi:hypothetical protein
VPSSGVTLSISLSAWPSKNVTLFVKVIARMHFVKESSLMRKSRSFVHPPVTLTPTLMSPGNFGTPCMGYDVVLAIGTTTLMQSSGQSVLPHCWKIPASIWGSFRILWTRQVPNPSLLFPWVYTSMTLCISQKIRPSKLCFVAS